MNYFGSRAKSSGWFLGILGPFLFTSPVCAQVIFDGGMSAPVTGGYYADGGLNGFGYGGISFTAAGDVFTSQSDSTAKSIQFTGSYEYVDSPSDTFTIGLYSVTSGAPADLLSTSTLSYETRTNIGTSIFGSNHFQYQGNLSTPFVLSAGTSYYIDITDKSATDATTQFEFLLDGNASGDGVAYSYAPFSFTPPFVKSDGSASFLLDAQEVPEPSTTALFGLALSFLIYFRRCMSQS